MKGKSRKGAKEKIIAAIIDHKNLLAEIYELTLSN